MLDNANQTPQQLQGAAEIGVQQQRTSQLLGQVHHLTVKVTQMQQAMEYCFNGMRMDFSKQFATVNRNVNHVAIQPARRIVVRPSASTAAAVAAAVALPGAAAAATAADAPPAAAGESDLGFIELCPNPKSLADLWSEYTHGIGGRKPARDFTPSERGRCKFKYSRRKCVWDCIAMHVNAGYSAEACIAKIYQVYGEGLSNSKIIKCFQRDKQNGGHRNLRIVQPVAIRAGTMARVAGRMPVGRGRGRGRVGTGRGRGDPGRGRGGMGRAWLGFGVPFAAPDGLAVLNDPLGNIGGAVVDFGNPTAII